MIWQTLVELSAHLTVDVCLKKSKHERREMMFYSELPFAKCT